MEPGAETPDPWTTAGGAWREESKTLRLANWGQRAFAFAIDLLALLGILFLAHAILTGLVGESETLLVVLAGALPFAYFLGFTLAGGASPGKRMLRLRTAGLGGERPNAVQSVLEALSKTVLPLLIVDLVGGLVFGTGKRQRLFQRAARVVVVFEPPPPPKRVVFVP